MPIRFRNAFLEPILAATLSLTLGLCLTGCAISPSGPASLPASGSISGIRLSGMAHGGQQPISGAILQLYAAGQPSAPSAGNPIVGGFGQGATPLIAPGSMSPGSSNNYWPNGSPNQGATCTYPSSGGNTNNCTILPESDSSGFFNITADYTCPSPNSQVYLVATGGNPGLGGTVSNQYIALMGALGPCSGLATTYATLPIYISEISTVAAVYSLQQFIAAPDGTHAASAYVSQGGTYAPSTGSGAAVNIGASSGPVNGYGPDQVQTQQVGMVNAFSMVNNLYSINSGNANVATNAWATPYSAKINAIANTLAACVNSDGGPVSGGTSTNCSQLTGLTTVSGITPQDTIQMAWMMAQNPSHNASSIIALGVPSAPFQIPTPVSSSQSNLDLTIEVGFAPTFGSSSSASGSSAISGVQSAAIDENGNVWLYNFGGTGTLPITGAYISEIGPNGAALAGPYQKFTPAGGFTGTGTCSTSTVHTLTSSNTGLQQLAIDQNSYLWAANYNEASVNCGGYSLVHTLMRIDTDAPPASSSSTVPATTPGYYYQNSADAMTIDGSNNVWMNGSSVPLTSFTNGTSTYQNSATSLGAGAFASTADMLGNVWFFSGTACSSGNAGFLSQVVSSSIGATGAANIDALVNGIYSSGSTCTGGNQTLKTTAALAEGYMMAADANNGIWVVNESPANTNTVTYFAPQSAAWAAAVTGSTAIPTTGVTNFSTGASGTNGSLNGPSVVAVDGANHAWVSSVSIATGGSGDSLMELGVSLAANGNINSISSVNGSHGFIFPTTSNPQPHYARTLNIDPSGNIWIAGFSTSNYFNWITVVVGAATPVITPLTYQAEYGRIGQTPQ